MRVLMNEWSNHRSGGPYQIYEHPEDIVEMFCTSLAWSS